MLKKSIICTLLCVISNCISAQDLKKEWAKVLKSCGSAQIFGKESLEFTRL